MGSIIIPAAIMAGLGLFFATLLAVSYRYFRVYEDPRIEQVEDMLPGSNCGACGEPGCHGFAEKLVGGDVAPSKCSVSSPEGVEAIADFLEYNDWESDKEEESLTRAIREDPVLAGLTVILHTSLSGVFNKQMVEKVGANDFLPKWEPDTLAMIVQEHLKNHATGSAVA